MKYAHNRQNETSDCGIAVVQTILQRLDLSFENIHEKIEHVINANDTASEVQGLTLWDIQGLLKEFGITSDSYEITDIAKLSSQKYPSVVMVENEGMPHYCVIHSLKNNLAVISDPSKTKIERISIEELEKKFLGYAVCIDSIEKQLSDKKKESISYPRAVVTDIIGELSILNKILGISSFVISLIIPILSTFLLEFIIGNYLDILDFEFAFLTVVLTVSLCVIYHSLMKFNTNFKISLSNMIEKKVLFHFFSNKVEEPRSKVIIPRLKDR